MQKLKSSAVVTSPSRPHSESKWGIGWNYVPFKKKIIGPRRLQSTNFNVDSKDDYTSKRFSLESSINRRYKLIQG